jgi:hypothetical protein
VNGGCRFSNHPYTAQSTKWGRGGLQLVGRHADEELSTVEWDHKQQLRKKEKFALEVDQLIIQQ